MSRIARVVIPGCPHHIVHRGNRRQRVFFCDEDRVYYLQLLKKYGDLEGIRYWAYCLMNNHVHLIAVPAHRQSLFKGLGVAHWKYTLKINLREDWRGYLWQGRYFSCPLQDKYIFAAIRYVELNPVRAGIAGRADEYPWSSAKAHMNHFQDRLITENPLGITQKDWGAFLAQGTPESEARLIKLHSATGRPLGDECFTAALEKTTGRVLRQNKRGRKSLVGSSESIERERN